jgi:ubiquinone/menaquinone biosynthesis C-methylase UbiE
MWGAIYDGVTAPLERAILAERRATLLPGISGVILDVGAGTGANLPHFRSATRVVATEPAAGMRKRLTAKARTARCPVEIIDAPAERLPQADDCFDGVVFTCVLCSVADPDRALAQAWRTLRPGGHLVVLEHVRGTGRLARRQDLITPVWSKVAFGCHPNRDTEAAIRRAGFVFEAADRFDPFPRWVPTRPMLQALAVKPR